MLSEAERKAKCKSFIESSKFGLDTWITIHALDENVKNMIMTITVYRKLIKKLDEGLFSNEFPPAQMLRIKQHIVLDMILKTEIIIESSLIFTYQLAKGSRGYRALPKTMSRYDTNLIKIVKIKVWKRGFPLRTALRLPLISHLHIERDEAKVLETIYQDTERNVWEALCKIVDFYDKFETVYNKYKHGLVFRTGAGLKDGNTNSLAFEKSSLIALDRKGVNDLPKNYIPYNTDDVLAPGWFNAISHLNFGQNLIDEIFIILDAVQKILSYVCSNHKTFAINCGESYLPFLRINDNQIMPAFFGDFTDKRAILESIAAKVFPEMNAQSDELYEDFTYKKGHLVKAIRNNTITNAVQRSKGKKNN